MQGVTLLSDSLFLYRMMVSHVFLRVLFRPLEKWTNFHRPTLNIIISLTLLDLWKRLELTSTKYSRLFSAPQLLVDATVHASEVRPPPLISNFNTAIALLVVTVYLFPSPLPLLFPCFYRGIYEGCALCPLRGIYCVYLSSSVYLILSIDEQVLVPHMAHLRMRIPVQIPVGTSFLIHYWKNIYSSDYCRPVLHIRHKNHWFLCTLPLSTHQKKSSHFLTSSHFR